MRQMHSPPHRCGRARLLCAQKSVYLERWTHKQSILAEEHGRTSTCRHRPQGIEMKNFRDALERRQIGIYLCTVLAAAALSHFFPATALLGEYVNTALAVMLFFTFLQVPVTNMGKILTEGRFLAALLVTNFIVLPLSVFLLLPLFPADPAIRLGILLVLLTPCIDYVVTFSHMGNADAQRLAAATPVLLLAQMLLLPVFLGLFPGIAASGLLRAGPFLHAFAVLILLPLVCAGLVQHREKRKPSPFTAPDFLGIFCVPSTAVVLFCIIASVMPHIEPARDAALRAAPLYVIFAFAAPALGWGVSRLFRTDAFAGRAIAFSAGTRNSLVVLSLAVSLPGAAPVLPAVIVTQTLVELAAELVYIRYIARWGQ